MAKIFCTFSSFFVHEKLPQNWPSLTKSAKGRNLFQFLSQLIMKIPYHALLDELINAFIVQVICYGY